jgi:hypothetical protein
MTKLIHNEAPPGALAYTTRLGGELETGHARMNGSSRWGFMR